MATFFAMPKLGMNMEEGVVLHWLVPEGTEVKAGQSILEIETDKANADVEAPVDGVLARIVRREGETVPINGVLAVILAPGEEMPQEVPETAI